MLASLLAGAQHSLVLNMYGYDDPELDELICGKLDTKHVYVQMSLDKSQAGGVHEKELLAKWSNDGFGTRSRSTPRKCTTRSPTSRC
jgi:hypothetical protein